MDLTNQILYQAVTGIGLLCLLREHADLATDEWALPADMKEAVSLGKAAVMPGSQGPRPAGVSKQQPQQQASTCPAAGTPCSMQPCSMSMGDAMVTLVASPRKQAGGSNGADCENFGLSAAPNVAQQGLRCADGLPLQPYPESPKLGDHLVGDSSEGVSPCSSQLAYADAASTIRFTPVPLVDRIQPERSPLRLPQLPSRAPPPASCPTTPAGQCRQPAPEVATAHFVGRPVSANPESTRYILVFCNMILWVNNLPLGEYPILLAHTHGTGLTTIRCCTSYAVRKAQGGA